MLMNNNLMGRNSVSYKLVKIIAELECAIVQTYRTLLHDPIALILCYCTPTMDLHTLYNYFYILNMNLDYRNLVLIGDFNNPTTDWQVNEGGNNYERIYWDFWVSYDFGTNLR